MNQMLLIKSILADGTYDTDTDTGNTDVDDTDTDADNTDDGRGGGEEGGEIAPLVGG